MTEGLVCLIVSRRHALSAQRRCLQLGRVRKLVPPYLNPSFQCLVRRASRAAPATEQPAGCLDGRVGPASRHRRYRCSCCILAVSVALSSDPSKLTMQALLDTLVQLKAFRNKNPEPQISRASLNSPEAQGLPSLFGCRSKSSSHTNTCHSHRIAHRCLQPPPNLLCAAV